MQHDGGDGPQHPSQEHGPMGRGVAVAITGRAEQRGLSLG
jgi:hypothetical protein